MNLSTQLTGFIPLTGKFAKVKKMKLGQNFVEYFFRFLGNGVSRKIAFEIY